MSADELIIRPYTDKDRQTMITFIVSFQEFERRLESDRRPGIEMASEYLDYLLHKSKDGALLLAEACAIPAGYIAYWIDKEEAQFALKHDNYLLISDLYVSSTFRRRGVGTKLFQVAEAFGKAKDIATVQLHVLPYNAPARKMYTNLGYRDYKVVMTKSLNQS